MVTKSIKFNIPKKEEERLNKIAVSYGLSIGELFKKIASNVSNSVGEESWLEYSEETKKSFIKGLRDFKLGKVSSTL